MCKYSKTPIYRGLLGKGDIRGKLGFAGNQDLVNRGFTVFTAFNDFVPESTSLMIESMTLC